MILEAIGAASLLSALAAGRGPTDVLLGKPLVRFVEFDSTAWPTDKASWSTPDAQRFLTGLKMLVNIPSQEGALIAAGPDAVVIVYRTKPHSDPNKEDIFGQLWVWSSNLSCPVPWYGAPIPGIPTEWQLMAHELLERGFERRNVHGLITDRVDRRIGPLYKAMKAIPGMARYYYLSDGQGITGYHNQTTNQVFHAIADDVASMVRSAKKREREALNGAEEGWDPENDSRGFADRHFVVSVLQDMAEAGEFRHALDDETEHLFRRTSAVAVPQGVYSAFERRFANGDWSGTYSILTAKRTFIREGGNAYPKGHPLRYSYARAANLPLDTP